MFNNCYNVVLQVTMIVGIMINISLQLLIEITNYLIKEKAGTPRLFIRSGFSSQLLDNY